MRSDWVSDDVLSIVLAAMSPDNRLAVQLALHTGLRIGDVLKLKTIDIKNSPRPYVRDSKTGKKHRIYVPVELRDCLLQIAGKIYVFEGRLDEKEHRTRQAVYKDIKSAALVAKHGQWCGRKTNITPHTARKVAAVNAYKKGGIDAAAALLQHDKNHPLVTMIYALSDSISDSKSKVSSNFNSVKSTRKDQKGQS